MVFIGNLPVEVKFPRVCCDNGKKLFGLQEFFLGNREFGPITARVRKPDLRRKGETGRAGEISELGPDPNGGGKAAEPRQIATAR
jgi:hypothetical protein